MRVSYHPDVESMFTHLADRPGVECVEICDGVVLDFDSEGELVGIDIEKVSALPKGLVIPDRIPLPTATSAYTESSDA